MIVISVDVVVISMVVSVKVTYVFTKIYHENKSSFIWAI